jgi:hypothetical protein
LELLEVGRRLLDEEEPFVDQESNEDDQIVAMGLRRRQKKEEGNK